MCHQPMRETRQPPARAPASGSPQTDAPDCCHLLFQGRCGREHGHALRQRLNGRRLNRVRLLSLAPPPRRRLFEPALVDGVNTHVDRLEDGIGGAVTGDHVGDRLIRVPSEVAARACECRGPRCVDAGLGWGTRWLRKHRLGGGEESGCAVHFTGWRGRVSRVRR